MSAVRPQPWPRWVRWASALGALLWLAGPAAADPEDVVTSYHQAITLDADGTAHVVLDLTMDFGSLAQPRAVPDLLVKQGYDDTHDRIYRYSDVRATSPDAPAAGRRPGQRGLDPDPDRRPRPHVTGSHTYRITYDVRRLDQPRRLPVPERRRSTTTSCTST